MNPGRSMFGRLSLFGTMGLAMVACAGNGEEAPAESKGRAATAQSDVATFGAQSADEGERLYGRECAFCHVGRNTGAMMLGRRLGKDKAELHRRTDLDPGYVKAVVRNGIVNMPPLSKVEVTDQELDRIAAYLARKSKR
jgi:cytochrome c5